MRIRVCVQFLFKRTHRILQILPLIGVLLLCVRLAILIFHFFLNVFPVQEQSWLLQRAVLADWLDAHYYILAKLFKKFLISLHLRILQAYLLLHPILPHAQVLNDQLKRVIYPPKMLQLLVHFSGLLLQFLYLLLSRLNIALQLLYFVVKHKPKFLELLSFLF